MREKWIAILPHSHEVENMRPFFQGSLKYKEEYHDPGQDHYEQKYRERIIRNLKRRAKELGLDLVPQPQIVS